MHADTAILCLKREEFPPIHFLLLLKKPFPKVPQQTFPQVLGLGYVPTPKLITGKENQATSNWH